MMVSTCAVISTHQTPRNLSLPKVSAFSKLRNIKLSMELSSHLRQSVFKFKFVEFYLILLDFFNFCCGASPRFVGSARPTQQD